MIEEKEKLTEAIKEYQLSKQYKSESSKIFNSLEMGIVVVENNLISFQNQLFSQQIQ